MSRNEIRETLGKQLQLLSERSTRAKDRADYMELIELTKSMCLLTNTITLTFPTLP